VLSLNSKNRDIYKRLIEIYREENKLDMLCDEWLNIYFSQPENKMLEEHLIVALHKSNRNEEAKEIIKNSE
jgi:hypothetical protein